ncbi:hypothetical protein V9L05_01470 [Bernardetia sp. Wsw4-3y2]|uniref:hypothetical protein n=1 Tax=Bernardetia sp. Wsw4-3y2 TaxID=3127471 RepID=UPI0030CFB417
MKKLEKKLEFLTFVKNKFEDLVTKERNGNKKYLLHSAWIADLENRIVEVEKQLLEVQQ